MVKWKGLIETSENEAGKYMVVKEAEGLAPWGSRIKAKCERAPGYPELGIVPSKDLVVELPDNDGIILAILDGTRWKIWVTPQDGLHIVVPHSDSNTKTPPEEYFLACQQNQTQGRPQK